jgi:hypothetical protein
MQDNVEARLDVAGKGGQHDECAEIGDVVRNGNGDAVNDEVGDGAPEFGDGEMGSEGSAEGGRNIGLCHPSIAMWNDYSVMNLVVISRASYGRVALRRTTCVVGRK